MKRWPQEILQCFSRNEEEVIIKNLRLGFPTEAALTKRDVNGRILLRTYCVHMACTLGFFQLLKELVSLGCNIEALDSNKRSPLMVACASGQLAIVKYLTLSCKASLKGFDCLGHTIIHISALSGNLEVLTFIVEELGVHLKTLSSYKKTALSILTELYSSSFNSTIEKTLGYLIRKSHDVQLVSIPEEVALPSSLIYNCHEGCKEDLAKSSNIIGLRTRFKSQSEFEGVHYKKNPLYYNKTKKISPVTFSLDKLVSIKTDNVYRIFLNETNLIAEKQESAFRKSRKPTHGSMSSISSIKNSVRRNYLNSI